MMSIRWSFLPVLAALALAPMACGGPTEEDMKAKEGEISKLKAELSAAKGARDKDQAELQALNAQLEDGKKQLAEFGTNTDQMRRQLTEYKARAEQLRVMEERFRKLRERLEKLTTAGVKFGVRNNRMVIQLPGDILFDSGKVDLKREGKDALLAVADVIRNDNDLNLRRFQVAGHTDDVKYGGGPYHDNWGLSLERARQVLHFMIAPKADAAAAPAKGHRFAAKAEGGGGLTAALWSASGYGETDPQEGSIGGESPDQRKKNRRVELVLQPNVEEMLDLNSIVK